jgi:hypothetical protein
VHQAAGRSPVLVLVTDPHYTRMAWQGGDTSMEGTSQDGLSSGLELLTFDAWPQIPSTVTLSGAGQPDLQVAVTH